MLKLSKKIKNKNGWVKIYLVMEIWYHTFYLS